MSLQPEPVVNRFLPGEFSQSFINNQNLQTQNIEVFNVIINDDIIHTNQVCFIRSCLRNSLIYSLTILIYKMGGKGSTIV